MKLIEIKRLAEFDAIGSLMVSRHGKGWILCIFKKDSSEQHGKYSLVLETARGGERVFKTLDAIKKLVDSDLNNHQFLVC